MSDKRGKAKQAFGCIPNGYKCTIKGVNQVTDEGEDVPITFAPVLVKAATRDEEGESHGILVWWIDIDGLEHEAAIPKRLLHAPGFEAALQLIDGGLQVVKGKEVALLRYLSMFNVKKRLVAATCTGWMGDSFVLPNEVINQPEDQQIVYQPNGGVSGIAKAIHRSGDFDKWKAGMAGASDMIKFKVCFSLSAPVRYKVNIEAGGFHIYTTTSRGKTTVLQAAASVWGNGADPAVAGGGEVYIQRWNSTTNALEAIAEIFNDIYFPIDEVGEGDSKAFGQAIYRLLAGVGKNRSLISGDLRQSKSWRISVGSAGEIAVADFIESGGGKVKGGQLVRLADVDVEAVGALFPDGKAADDMKLLCATHFGHAGPEMLLRIPDIADGWHDFDPDVIGEAVIPEAKRVRKRFALAAFTGIKAVRAGILPWTEEEILSATQKVYGVWHGQINTLSDLDRGVKSVADFILKHAARFEVEGAITPRDRVGWCRDGIYHFTDGGFKEACNGSEPAKIRSELRDMGLLHLNCKGLKAQLRVDGAQIKVTSVTETILGGEVTEETRETGVSSAETQADKGLKRLKRLKRPKNDTPCSNSDKAPENETWEVDTSDMLQ